MLLLLELYKPQKISGISFRWNRKNGDIFKRPSFLLQSTFHEKHFLVSFDFSKRTFEVNEVLSFKEKDGKKFPNDLGNLQTIHTFNEMVDMLDS